MASEPAGWVLRISRDHEQQRNGRRRTVGAYLVLHDGRQTGLRGASVEAKGPGDNADAGCGRCLEPGSYPLATHDGEHYRTWGYRISDDPDQT